MSGFVTATWVGLGQGYWGGVDNDSVYKCNFDASRSNSIYGSSDTVTPTSLTCITCIKY